MNLPDETSRGANFNISLDFPLRYNFSFSTILIALESARDENRINLELTYQVCEARWTPSYDLRVETNHSRSAAVTDAKARSPPKLTLFYYGQIQQSTGEDWTETRLVLSTAEPRRGGGNLPMLPTLRAKFHEEPKPPPPMPQPAHGGGIFGRSAVAAAPSMLMMRKMTTATECLDYVGEEQEHALSYPVKRLSDSI